MKDEKGRYYHPFPQNKRVRMYVQKTGNDICALQGGDPCS